MKSYIGSKFRYLFSFIAIFMAFSFAMKIFIFPETEMLIGPVSAGGLGFLIAFCAPLLFRGKEKFQVIVNEKLVTSYSYSGTKIVLHLKEIDVKRSLKPSFLSLLNMSYILYAKEGKKRIEISNLMYGFKSAKKIHQDIVQLAENA